MDVKPAQTETHFNKLKWRDHPKLLEILRKLEAKEVARDK